MQLDPEVEAPGPQDRAELLDDVGRVVRRPVRTGLPAHTGDPGSRQDLSTGAGRPSSNAATGGEVTSVIAASGYAARSAASAGCATT